ncbi:MAG: hypothetical protein KJO43_10020, partial [Phycisphaerae bacterium]|nr:hypothetical protein [Phycisphaerae bacterium]
AADDATDIYSWSDGATYNMPPIDNRRWLFVRQPVLLVDDDTFAADTNAKTRYLGQVQSARSIFQVDPALGLTPQVRDGRVDAAAMGMDDVRRLIEYAVPPDPTPLSWRGGALGHVKDQYSHIAKQMMYYPRAERTAPSMNRVDQALTSHVLSSACSEVRIEWTYANGVGATAGFNGVFMDPAEPQVWFGPEDPARGVVPYGAFASGGNGAETIFTAAIEGPGNPLLGADVYDAFFGFNQQEPLDGNGQPDLSVGYTPWPTAIRITLTLHDPRTTLEGGRAVQFVIHLPQRGVKS